MSFSVTITLSSIVGSPGPYNLYSNTDSYTTAFATGVSATGNVITSSSVPDGTTNIKIVSTASGCNYETPPIEISGLPSTPTPTPTQTSAPTPTSTSTNTPTPTATTLGVTTLGNVSSGTTLSEVCEAGAGSITLFFSGTSIQIGESLYLTNTGGVLSNPVPAGYYYYPDYNTIYNVTNGSTGAVASTPDCPTPTPLSTFVGYDFTTGEVSGITAISLVDDDGVTVCSSPEYVIGNGTSGTVQWNFIVWGTDITDATGIASLSSGFRSELTLNAIFYVRQRVSGVFYWRKFQLNGSPGDTNVTASPIGTYGEC